MTIQQTNGSTGVSVASQFRDQFSRMQGEIQAALPAHIPLDRFMRVVLTAVNESPDLLMADRRSLLSACMKAAQDGLLPDGRDGALVIYNTKTKIDGKETWIAKVQWMPMMGGLIKKARNSGEIKSIEAHAVREGDRFLYVLGDNPRLEHEPDLESEEPGALRFAYAIAWLKSGAVIREVMTRAQIAQVRAASKSKDGPAWTKWEDEMWRKAAFRRLFKWLPKSSDLDDLVRRDDALYEFGDRDKSDKAALEAARRGLFQPVANPLADEPQIDPVAASDDGRVDPETGEVEEIRQEAPGPRTGFAGAVSGKPLSDSGANGKAAQQKPKEADGAPEGDNDGEGLPAGPVGRTHAGKLAQPAQPAPEPEPITENDIVLARARGAQAYSKKIPRSVIPREFRSEGLEPLRDAYIAGYDAAATLASRPLPPAAEYSNEPDLGGI